MKKQFLEAGRIVGTHGVRGEMRVEPWCDSAEFLKNSSGSTLTRAAPTRASSLPACTRALLLVRLAGVERDRGRPLPRGVLYLDRNDVRLPKNRYFIQRSDRPLSVIDDATGAVYGTVQEVFETGANNVYRIAGANGAEYLFRRSMR